MKLTEQQKGLVRGISRKTPKGGGVLIGEARAGTGKTSTLLEGAIVASDGGAECFVGVFNKAIQVDWDRKLTARGIDRGVDARTFHSLGLQTVGKGFSAAGRRVVPSDRVLEEVIKPFGLQGRIWGATLKLVGLAKQALLTESDPSESWEEVASHYGLDEDYKPSELSEVLRLAPKVLAAGIKRFHETLEIDFNDMLYLPDRFELPTPRQFPIVMVDEAQDSNQARINLAFKLVKKDGLLVPVGDRFQAIYGFSGASAGALEDFQRQGKAARMSIDSKPLTVCWRCPESVIELARRIVPDIEAAPGAKQGKVEGLSEAQAYGAIAPGSAVLCRFNAPLAKLALKLLRDRRPVRIEGKDIGKSILALAKKFDRPLLKDLQKAGQESWEADRRVLILKGSPLAKIEALDDRYETLLYFVGELIAQGKTATAELSLLLNSLFEDTQPGHPGFILLSSIHKAKGREWRKVYLWGFNNFVPKAQGWQAQQESNIRYVAITRAMEELYVVEV
jgi:ATP-dependent DNA helicase UvrD/PcrA